MESQSNYEFKERLEKMATCNEFEYSHHLVHILKSRKEIAEYLNIKTTSFVTKEYIQPLVDAGKLKLTIPDKPKSKNQKYYSD